MLVYIVMIIISILFLIIANKSKSKKVKSIFYIFSAFCFFIVSALRYGIGTDYLKRYVSDYNRMAEGLDVENLEIGFKILVKFCILFTKSPNILFVITSAIIITLIMSMIFLKSKNIILSVLIFFLGGFFFDSLNLVRQYVAISIILFSSKLLIKENMEMKDYMIFIISVVLATLIHVTSLIAIFFVLLNKKKLMNWKIVFLVCICILIFNKNIRTILDYFLEFTRFRGYISKEMSDGKVSVLFLLENLLVYIFMYYVFCRRKENSRENIFLLNIQSISLIVTCLGAVHIQFARIALYFLIYQIISIPNFIENIPLNEIGNDVGKFLKHNIDEKNLLYLKNSVVITFILCFCVIFWYNNIKNNNNEVVPYKTIFSIKEK